MAQTKVLDVETYDSAEAKAIEGFPIRVNQAFFPEMFASVGYPARVTRPDQLWRYIDVMHETRVEYNMDYLLFGLTEREFELFKQVTQLVDKHASESYGRRAHASSALLRRNPCAAPYQGDDGRRTARRARSRPRLRLPRHASCA